MPSDQDFNQLLRTVGVISTAVNQLDRAMHIIIEALKDDYDFTDLLNSSITIISDAVLFGTKGHIPGAVIGTAIGTYGEIQGYREMQELNENLEGAEGTLSEETPRLIYFNYLARQDPPMIEPQAYLAASLNNWQLLDPTNSRVVLDLFIRQMDPSIVAEAFKGENTQAFTDAATNMLLNDEEFWGILETVAPHITNAIKWGGSTEENGTLANDTIAMLMEDTLGTLQNLEPDDVTRSLIAKLWDQSGQETLTPDAATLENIATLASEGGYFVLDQGDWFNHMIWGEPWQSEANQAITGSSTAIDELVLEGLRQWAETNQAISNEAQEDNLEAYYQEIDRPVTQEQMQQEVERLVTQEQMQDEISQQIAPVLTTVVSLNKAVPGLDSQLGAIRSQLAALETQVTQLGHPQDPFQQPRRQGGNQPLEWTPKG